VALDPGGNLLNADTNNHRIRQVAGDRRIRTVAGTGTAGVGPGAITPMATNSSGPRALCTNGAASKSTVDTGNKRIMPATAAGGRLRGRWTGYRGEPQRAARRGGGRCRRYLHRR